MDWSVFWSGFLGTGLAVAIAGGLIGAFISHGLEIKREKYYNKMRRDNEVREASEAIAEILSEWVKTSYTGKFSNIDRWKMQSIYWKRILRIDKELLSLLFSRLANDSRGVDTNELIVQARRVVLGLKEPDIKATDLNNWEPIKKEPEK